MTAIWWIIAAGCLLVSFGLLCLNARGRRQIDEALKQAEPWAPEPTGRPDKDASQPDIRHWEFDGVTNAETTLVGVPPAPEPDPIEPPDRKPPEAKNPERMFTYSHTDVERFMRALSPEQLELYAGPILGRDMWFAAFLALAVAAAAVAAMLQWPAMRLLQYVGGLSAVFGVLYGAADLGEDRLLRQIVRHARQAHHDNFAEPGARHIDAAQVDAANALTRLKRVTLCLSVTGVIAWFGMTAAAARLVASHRSPPSPPRAGGSASGDGQQLSASPDA